MSDILGSPPYSLKFLISLPYWIEISNNSKYYKKYNNFDFEITIEQNKWLIHYRSIIDSAWFIADEEQVIDPKFLKPKLDFDDLIPLLPREKELGIRRHYYPEKLKSMLSIRILNKEFSNYLDILQFLRKKENNIWEIIKNLIRFFISNYTYIKINSNSVFHRIRPLSDKYFTPKNTFIYYVSKKDNFEHFLDIGSAILGITQEFNFPNFICNPKTKRVLKKKIFCSKEFKIKLSERLRILIDFAKMQRDMNSLIINISIYLEKVSIEFLKEKRKMKSWELDILFEKKGLRHFVNSQLPCFIKEEEYSKLILDAIEIVDKRNEIIHLGVVYAYELEIQEKCEKVLRLIKYLEQSVKPDKYKNENFIFDLNLTGMVVDTVSSDTGLIFIPESKAEHIFVLKNFTKFDKSTRFLVDSDKTYGLPEKLNSFLKIFVKDDNTYIIFVALHPTRFSINLTNLNLLFSELKEKIEPNLIIINFCYIDIPKGTLEIYKKLFNSELQIYISELKCKKFQMNFVRSKDDY